ncbi:uncharacterized protein F4812DRAFT_471076 [Daldinia caldariorum]|uniref:uncharacterized protein n=1 Tax=Daldinia caldariorum TaxID=326644 RepID=UPI0020082C70|nr:uncharacterized protein F4812DRAFT_471076 [Daldinia caldariorum]KAI1468554.1 hypothetical protein F4812DRAFT_471076 [Daldinia caldariorum]
MRFPTCILAFAAFVFGQDVQPVDTWTLYNSTITCDLTTCLYNFFAYKHNSGETVQCHLNKTGAPGITTFFVDQTCQRDPRHTLTLSWAPDRSVILCIADIHEHRNAFYGLEKWEIAENRIVPNKTEWAWRAGEVPLPSSTYARPVTTLQQ